MGAKTKVLRLYFGSVYVSWHVCGHSCTHLMKCKTSVQKCENVLRCRWLLGLCLSQNRAFNGIQLFVTGFSSYGPFEMQISCQTVDSICCNCHKVPVRHLKFYIFVLPCVKWYPKQACNRTLYADLSTSHSFNLMSLIGASESQLLL